MLYVISKEKQGDEFPHHDIQWNSRWTENPYPDTYVIIPESVVDRILPTKGFCNLALNEDGTEVLDFSKLPIPEIPVPEEGPTTEEKIAELEAANIELMEQLAAQSSVIDELLTEILPDLLGGL